MTPMQAAIYCGEMVVAPIVAVALLVASSLSWTAMAGLFLAGVLALTLGEYAVHRFVLHDLKSIRHRLHHARPDDQIITIFWQIWVCFAVVGLIAGGAVLSGALAAYTWYLMVHHCAHHDRSVLPSRLQRHHEGHHQFATRNYGVSTTLWDHVFGTVLR
jgi:sterol desaturase/sphingolipid hydroxylase (fatty acid hydroxylase superfamily)